MKNFLIFLFIITSCSGFAQTFTVTATEVCLYDETKLVCYSSLPDDSIASWNWDMNNNGVYTDADTDIVRYSSTAYYIFQHPDTNTINLKVIKKNGGAEFFIQKKIVVNPLPSVNFHIDNTCEFNAAICISTSTITTGAISQFHWDFNNDGAVDDNSNDTVNYTCGPATIYQTKLECISDKGCSASAIKTTQVYSQPVADFNVQSTCMNDTTFFINTTALAAGNIAYYSWNFGDGAEEVASDPNHVYSSLLSCTVSLIAVSDHFCADTAKQAITVHPLPTASFTYSGDTLLAEGESVTITVNSAAGNYFWSTGATSDNITVSVGGNYSVEATDVHGCETKIATDIVVKGANDVVNVLSDVLTPNGDGKNDMLIIEELAFYKNCSLTIYNRWNEKIYSAANYNNDWDGTVKGHPLDAGAYFYIIMCDGKTETTGTINILR